MRKSAIKKVILSYLKHLNIDPRSKAHELLLHDLQTATLELNSHELTLLVDNLIETMPKNYLTDKI